MPLLVGKVMPKRKETPEERKARLEAERQERLAILKDKTNLDWVAEHRFHATRKWRMDFAQLDHKIYIEIQGGIFVQGRHSRGAGMLKDFEKFNHAVLDGWRLILTTPQDFSKDMVKYILPLCQT